MGDAWTADYLKITGDLAADLRSNIAAEVRAKIVYERLMAFTDDSGTKEALQFLMTREITHSVPLVLLWKAWISPHSRSELSNPLRDW
jgi:Mn-containing catalase